MITIEQAARGLTSYLDTELLPHLPAGKALMVGTAAALYIRKAPDIARQLIDMPVVKLLGIVDEQGNIDIDELYNAVLPQVRGTFELRVPLVGSLTFDRAEIDKLYSYLKGA